jgi:hypothetical protein
MDTGHALGVVVRSTGRDVMVAMSVPREIRIRYTRLLVNLVGGDLCGRCSHGLMNLIQSTCFRCLVLKDSDQMNASMATTSALGCWSIGAHVRRLPDCDEQRQAGSSRAAMKLCTSCR